MHGGVTRTWPGAAPPGARAMRACACRMANQTSPTEKAARGLRWASHSRGLEAVSWRRKSGLGHEREAAVPLEREKRRFPAALARPSSLRRASSLS